MGNLDTKVQFNGGDVTNAATWCDSVSHALHDVGGDIKKASTDSESSYEGAAGDALRNDLNQQVSGIDDFTQKVDKVRDALNTFRDEMNTVKQRMEQAHAVAAQGGCQVAGDTIVDPGPAPQPSGLAAASGPIPPEQAHAHADAVQAHQAAAADHARKVKAFNEAKATVDDARQKENDAHDGLGTKLQEFKLREFNDTKARSIFWGGNALSAIRTAPQLAKDLTDGADTLKASAIEQSRRWLSWWDKPGTRASSAALRAAGVGTDWTAGLPMQSDKLRKVIDADPLSVGLDKDSATRRAAFNDLGKAPFDFKGESAGRSASRFGAKAVKGVPFLGTAVTVGSGAVDVATGSKSVGQAAASTGGSVVGGAVGTAAGAAFGSVIPVVGTSIGGFLGGMGGSILGDMIGSSLSD